MRFGLLRYPDSRLSFYLKHFPLTAVLTEALEHFGSTVHLQRCASDKLVSSRGAPRGDRSPPHPPPHTTSTLPSTPEAPAISQSPASSTCPLMTLPSFHGSTGVMRQLSVTKTKELVGTKVPLIPISIQGSIADTIGEGGGVHPGNKLEWAKLLPGFSEEVLQRLQGDATYVI